MTTAAATTAREAPRTGVGSLTGTVTLLRFQLSHDRFKLPGWVAGIGLFAVYVTYAVPLAYAEDELRDATALFADPVGRLLTGPGYGFDDPTYERFVANGYGLYLMVASALMSILLVVRHTRVEEQSGRAELVRANVVGRHAILTAALATAVVTNLAVVVVVAAVLLGVGGFGTGGSLLLAAAIGATGLAFAGITAVTVQLSEYSRGASGIAGAALGAAFVLRAGGDVAGEGGSALSWLSPLGWAQQTAPFVLDRWWPLLLLVGLGVAASAMGFALSTRRDLGASLIAVRPGPARARPALGTPVGLALRLGRASIIGWSASLAVSGLAFGAFAQPMLDAADDLPDVIADVFATEDILTGYLAYIASFMALFVAVYAIQAVQGWRTEETGGRMEPVLATPVGRATWLGANLIVATIGVVAATVAAGLGAGIGAALVTGDASHIGGLLGAHLNHVPAALLVLAVATLLYGALPRIVPVVWVIVGYALITGTFGAMLDLPQLAFDLSPFEHAASMPLEAFDLAPVAILTGLAAVITAVGVLAFRRRDITTT